MLLFQSSRDCLNTCSTNCFNELCSRWMYQWRIWQTCQGKKSKRHIKHSSLKREAPKDWGQVWPCILLSYKQSISVVMSSRQYKLPKEKPKRRLGKIKAFFCENDAEQIQILRDLSSYLQSLNKQVYNFHKKKRKKVKQLTNQAWHRYSK